MILSEILGTFWFAYIVLPLLIFLSRVIDVSIGTIRVIFVAKGFTKLAPFLGFFEVSIWLLAMRQIMQNLDNWVCYVAYGLGFAVGNYVGMLIEQKLSFGKVIVRAVSKQDSSELLERLNSSQFKATSTGSKDSNGEVHLITCVTDKKKVSKLVGIIKEHNPHSFYSIEDVRYVYDAEDGEKVVPKKKRPNILSFVRKFK
ncbi:MAG: DUF2179 domain-containing protein [Nanoarchaeota archaeon]|nr:DUF2179 domain-containing protein [Nanoarchaeota archaeon]